MSNGCNNPRPHEPHDFRPRYGTEHRHCFGVAENPIAGALDRLTEALEGAGTRLAEILERPTRHVPLPEREVKVVDLASHATKLRHAMPEGSGVIYPCCGGQMRVGDVATRIPSEVTCPGARDEGSHSEARPHRHTAECSADEWWRQYDEELRAHEATKEQLVNERLVKERLQRIIDGYDRTEQAEQGRRGALTEIERGVRNIKNSVPFNWDDQRSSAFVAACDHVLSIIGDALGAATEAPQAAPGPGWWQHPDGSDRRLKTCVEQWPDAETMEYNPSCCRFPKSCSATVYDPERVTEDDLEPRRPS